MKNKNGLNYTQIILVAVVAELVLIVMQFVYLNVYATRADAEFRFTSEYMKSTGFYIFQIIGFFMYASIVYVLAGKINNKLINKLIVLVAIGGIAELTFYIIMQANYEGAFLYSILDKVIGAAFGLIVFNYTTSKKKKPESYL